MSALPARPQRDWCTTVHALGVVRVAEAFGARLVDEAATRHGLAPCPACKAVTRHTKRNDKRGAVVLVADGDGWKCLQCEAKGDAVTWAAYATTGQPKASAEVRAACERAGLVGDAASGLMPRPRLVESTGPKYPPADEVSKLVASGCPVTAESQAAAWLLSIPLDTALVAELGAVIALPETATVPLWARFGDKPWARAGYRLIAPLVDAQGALRSVHARRTTSAETPKTLNPTDHEIGGLVLACPRARRMLCGSEVVGLVVVAEGFRDWLVALYGAHTKRSGAAVLGVVGPGSWTQELADRLPDGCRIVVATDHDKEGHKYAAAIAKTFATRMRQGRVNVGRWEPTR